VPPFAILNTPPKVKVPELVIGPPVKVNPVVPPDTSTDVTAPKAEVSTPTVKLGYVPEIITGASGVNVTT
jgi:hypothetical protein